MWCENTRVSVYSTSLVNKQSGSDGGGREREGGREERGDDTCGLKMQKGSHQTIFGVPESRCVVWVEFLNINKDCREESNVAWCYSYSFLSSKINYRRN